MTSFETKTIEVSQFIELLLKIPLKALIAAFVLVFICWFLFLRGNETYGNNYLLTRYPFFLWLTFKAFLYGLLAVCVFFYDFSSRELVWILPETMLLSTAFVGMLAVYECISSTLDAIKEIVR